MADRIVAHRERMAKLPEFEIRYVDNLVDYAKAAWYAYVTNLPAADPRDLTQYMTEVASLRSKLLMWATPLVGAGKFDDSAIAKIKDGSGHKDTASDLVALVGLYRSRSDEVKNMCGVTDEELARADQIAPAVFALLSRRDFQTNVMSDGSLRVRRAWTLLDRAYSHCRRALSFLRYEDGDADTLPLDVASWVAPRDDGRIPAVIVSVAHLDDDERALVLGIILDQLLAWVRSLTGTHQLRALLMLDEVYGFIPPHPSNPPTKRPLVSLMKQARAFGLGVVIATQNPMDLDYRALSNAGVWCIGRLQTDADRERVVDALSGNAAGDVDAATLANVIKVLKPRWFVLRNAHQTPGTVLLQSRTTLCWLKGPMTRGDLKRLVADVAKRA